MKNFTQWSCQKMAKLKPIVLRNKSQRVRLSLLKTLVQRDMEARYKGSILGNLWPLLNQLSQLLVYTYVFAVVLRVKLSLKGIPEGNSFVFGLWLFAGLVPWIAFSSGLMQSAGSVIAQPNLVKKVVFPLSLLPLVAYTVELFRKHVRADGFSYVRGAFYWLGAFYAAVVAFGMAAAAIAYRRDRLFSSWTHGVYSRRSSNSRGHP